MKPINCFVLSGCLFLFVLAGCATTNHVYNKDLLSFLEDGKTSRDEVLLKLGNPSSKFEGERIFTYKIGGDKEKGYRVLYPCPRWEGVGYSMILVFDENSILSKHSLIQVR
jgi:hypothetical protein